MTPDLDLGDALADRFDHTDGVRTSALGAASGSDGAEEMSMKSTRD